MRNGPDRRSPRLRGYDYRTPCAYFVTMCTHGRECSFGELEREILEYCWGRIGRYATGARGDTFVAMPNHVHGILWLTKPRRDVLTPNGLVVPTGSLGAVIRGFKSVATKRINLLRGSPGAPVWQRNHHDRIIRADNALERIRTYIIDNPRKWADDPNNPANLAAPYRPVGNN